MTLQELRDVLYKYRGSANIYFIVEEGERILVDEGELVSITESAAQDRLEIKIM